MKKHLFKLLWSEDGPTSVEYAVMLALGLFIGSVKLIGEETSESVDHSAESIETAFTEAGVGNL